MGIFRKSVTLERGLRGEFMKAKELDVNPILDKLMMKVPSTNTTEKYAWLGRLNKMKEWVDTKQVESVIDKSYSLENLAFENTFGVDKFDILNDNVNGAYTRIRDLATQAKEFPQILMIDRLIENGICYDGQNFLDTDHSEGDSGAQVNTASGAGVAIANIVTDFRAARARMRALKDSKGNPIWRTAHGLNLVVLCPTALEGVFEELLNAAYISQTENVLKGAADLVVLPALDANDANDWYLCAYTNSGLAPFILQENQPAKFVAQEEESEGGFFHRTYHYGCEWYGNVGYGMWQMIQRIVNT